MKLLIFTVAGPGDSDISQDAALNIIELNPNIDINYVIINNSGEEIQLKFPFIENLSVVEGIPNNGQYPPSVHHALAINYFLATIISSDYDYYLLLDPDVIQIQLNAISSIVSTMISANASVYSFPWHLKWYSKFRSRTSPHFMLFSRHVLETKILNFSPSLREKPLAARFLSILNSYRLIIKSNSQCTTSRRSKHVNEKALNLPFHIALSKLISSFFLSRLAVNSARDTGYKNSYRFFELNGLKVLIGGMFISSRSMQNIYHLRFNFLAMLEKNLIPSFISFIPSNEEYIYSDKYDSLSAQFNLEIMSIDFKSATFVHLRKFNQTKVINNLKSIQIEFEQY